MKTHLRSRLAPGIRLQITLWYTMVFALLLLIISAVSYVNVRSSLDANLDTTLALRAHQIAAGISDDNGLFVIEDVSGQLPGLGTSPTATATSSDDGSSSNQHDDDSSGEESHEASIPINVDASTLIRIFDKSSRVIYSSLAAQTLPVLANTSSHTLAGTPWYDTVNVSGGKAVRVYNYPLAHSGTIYGLVQVGASLASTDATLHSVLLGWIFLVPIVLLLGALGSYWLASRAFTPVSRLTRIARNVEASDLRQRVPVPRPHDELRELALTLNEMIGRLDNAFARQRRFVADASHELRTPVTAIRSLTDVALLHEKSPAEYVNVLRGVNAEAERLSRLISDLLALARADEGVTPLGQVPLRLDVIAHDVVAVSSVLAAEKGISVRVITSGPVVVLADEDRLLQAVLNLLDNAITYTPAWSDGVVTLAVRAENDEALFSVQDTGIGIEPGHLPHIFERFYRVDPARASSSGSSGLGLAIVDWVVRAHRGTISVQSQVGVGSIFTIHLPLASSINTTDSAKREAVKRKHETKGTL